MNLLFSLKINEIYELLNTWFEADKSNCKKNNRKIQRINKIMRTIIKK